MLKKSVNLTILLFVVFVITTGCTVEQKKPMGANPNLDEGFSGYGTMNVKDLEGPLTDLSIPDSEVKGRSKVADEIADGEPYYRKEPNLGFSSRKDGTNIYSGRVGLVNDKHMTSDSPHLKKKKEQHEIQGGSIEDKIRQRLENLETVNNVYLVSDDGYLLVGVESSEEDRAKLRREVQNEIKQVTSLEKVRIALDNQNIKRIQKLQNRLSEKK